MRTSVASFIAIAVTAGIAATGCTVHYIDRSKPQPPPPAATAPAATAPAAKPTVTKTPARKIMLKPGALRGYKLKAGSKGKVDLPGPVLFEPNSNTLLPESGAVLDTVAQYLAENPQVTLMRIEGHTDLGGEDTSNMELSKARAMAVALYIASKGTACKRLLPVGFGETKPLVNPEQTDEDKAVNRRVSFVNAQINGKPLVAGYPEDGGGQSAGDPCQK